jgi:hypothetical protein
VAKYGCEKPSLRVTKWEGKIAVEGGCTAWDVQFKIKAVTRIPTREEYAKTLQREFGRRIEHAHLRKGKPKD